MVENLQIYKDASELIKRIFIINLKKFIALKNNLNMLKYEKLA
jgi:hypothetical protein